MRDPRLDKLARLMLNHSMRISKGESFHISSDIAGIPLVKAILAEAGQAGALAQVELTNQEVSRCVLETYKPDDGGITASFLADKAQTGIRQFQNLVGSIVIRAYANDQELAGIPPAVLQLSAAQGKPFKDLLIDQRRWVLFEYPAHGQAQRLGMSYDRYYDFVMDVACVDYQAMAVNAGFLKALMEKTDRVRITGPGTDLAFSIRDMAAVPCCGEYNIPDGECFTAPVRDSVHGVITYNAPSNYWGRTFNGIRFEFDQGRIVKASADQHSDTLAKILDSDEGARYVGEFALGFNPLIREPFCNTLFDEKICGSFHFTPGSCYKDAPNGNDSTIHWDLVQIQRPEYGGGEIWFDDVLIRKDGLFTLPELKALNP
jgi:aminopeptidase